MAWQLLQNGEIVRLSCEVLWQPTKMLETETKNKFKSFMKSNITSQPKHSFLSSTQFSSPWVKSIFLEAHLSLIQWILDNVHVRAGPIYDIYRDHFKSARDNFQDAASACRCKRRHPAHFQGPELLAERRRMPASKRTSLPKQTWSRFCFPRPYAFKGFPLLPA